MKESGKFSLCNNWSSPDLYIYTKTIKCHLYIKNQVTVNSNH